MYEKRIPPVGLKEFEFPEQSLYVIVNKLEETTLKDFIKDCEKVLQTGQPFLPIVIDSYGGEVYTLLGMMDFLKQMSVKVITVSQCKAMSAGALLFSSGQERYVGPNCTIMIHEISACFWGKNIEIQNGAKEIERLNKMLFGILDKNTGQKPGYWWNVLETQKHVDIFLTPEQARKHGLATHIGIPHIETRVEVTRSLVL